MTRLYGKESLVSLLSEIAEENRLPHAILLTGEKGSGRKTMAKYIAKRFLCGAHYDEGGSICAKVDSGEHPDVIFVLGECSGKYALTSPKKEQKTFREIMGGVAVKPNDGDVKVYIFEDADSMSPLIQDTLLKNIEEPLPWVRYIFICENSGNLLTTIRSRVSEFAMPECPPAECRNCLEHEYGIPADKAKEYSEIMSGNIGKCLEAINGGDEIKLMETAERCAAGLAGKNGYALCAALAEQTGRKEYSAVLDYLAGILRDAIAVRSGADMTSCGKAEARALASTFSDAAITDMLSSLLEVNSLVQSANLNIALSSAYLTAELLNKGQRPAL